MTTGPVEEQLSAYLDDELPPAELEVLVARLARSDDQRAVLARYSLIGESLRGASARTGALALSRRVSAVLDGSEPTAVMPGPGRRGRARLLVPVALAAAAALGAVALVQSGLQGPPPDSTAAGIPTGATPVAFDPPIVVPVARRASLAPDRLTNYLVYHGKYANLLSAKVMDSHIVSQGDTVRAISAVEPVPGE